MEVTKPIIQTLIDTTTSVEYIYIWEAPILAWVDSQEWTISRVYLLPPYSIQYWRSQGWWNIEKQLKNKWTDRTSLTY